MPIVHHTLVPWSISKPSALSIWAICIGALVCRFIQPSPINLYFSEKSNISQPKSFVSNARIIDCWSNQKGFAREKCHFRPKTFISGSDIKYSTAKRKTFSPEKCVFGLRNKIYCTKKTIFSARIFEMKRFHVTFSLAPLLFCFPGFTTTWRLIITPYS